MRVFTLPGGTDSCTGVVALDLLPRPRPLLHGLNRKLEWRYQGSTAFPRDTNPTRRRNG